MKLAYGRQSTTCITAAVSNLGSGFAASRRFLGIPMLLGDIVLMQGELCLYCQ